ncbi:MAG: hypothetical protein HFH90_08795 [Lachnospiraceae bacterium]|jgi:hypothetical protein|nr:hypothetical protein [Lachnospiraceae bacterium]
MIQDFFLIIIIIKRAVWTAIKFFNNPFRMAVEQRFRNLQKKSPPIPQKLKKINRANLIDTDNPAMMKTEKT